MGTARQRLRSVDSDAVEFVRAVVDVSRDGNVSFVAGSLAYHAFVSLVPLAAFGFLALAAFGTEQFAARVLTLTEPMLSPELNALLGGHIAGGAMTGTAGATVIALATLLWGTHRLFRGLDAAFADIYRTSGERSTGELLADVVVVVLTVPLALVIVLVTTTVVSVVPDGVVRVVGSVVLTPGLVVVFLPLYAVLPGVDHSLREALPGAVVAAVGWMALQQLFQLYVLLSGNSAGSVVGAAILFLTWLYFAGVVLLVGGVVNAVSGGYHSRRRERGAGERDGAEPDVGAAAPDRA